MLLRPVDSNKQMFWQILYALACSNLFRTFVMQSQRFKSPNSHSGCPSMGVTAIYRLWDIQNVLRNLKHGEIQW